MILWLLLLIFLLVASIAGVVYLTSRIRKFGFIEKVFNSSSTSISTSTSIINPSSYSSSSQEPSGDLTTVDGYRLVTRVNELDNANKVIIGAYDSNQLYGMTPNAKSEKLPGYITGESLKEVNDHKDIKDITITAVWDLSKTCNSYKFSICGKET